ncbi:MAG TPA: nitroreductase family protein [Bacteroidales bacterium]|nr:nitroreductase family protein [Bacteroidales bacterium]
MEAIETILTRRSIRKFKEVIISDDLLEKIIDCGIAAPSARNKQPWHLIVVRKKETLKAIMEVHPYAKMLENASLAIIICGDTIAEPELHYIPLNCAAVTQNILLAVHALGLAGVWLGVYARKDREEGVRKIFKLPEHIIPVSIVAIGLADETPDPIRRIKEGKIHYEKF